jgi:PAS domain S-box-containing protein
VPQEHKVYLPPGGTMGELIRSHDWSTTPLGPIEQWPQTLLTNLATILESPFPHLIYWGRQLTIFYNDAYTPLLGNKEEALGKCFFDVWPELRDSLEPLIEKAFAGESIYVDSSPFHLIRHGYPEQTWFNFSLSPLRDLHGNVLGLFAIVIEMTRRERELKEREERFRATFEQAAVGMAHVDLSGKFLRINEKFFQITGYPPDELLQLTFQEITHPEDLDLDVTEAKRLLSGEINTYSMEKRYIRKNGTIVWINLTGSLVKTYAGRPDYFIAVVEDISERKRAEESLRESEERSSKSFHSNPAPMAITDIETGRVIDINTAWLQMLGYTREEIIGRTTIELGIWADSDQRPGVIRKLRSNGSLREAPLEFVTKSGEIRHALWSAELIEYGGRSVMLSLIYDTTERKSAEEARETLTKQLNAERERLETILRRLPAGVMIADDTGRVHYANEYALRIYGQSFSSKKVEEYQEEWQPTHLDGRTVKFDEIPMVQALQGRVITGVEMRLARPDGSDFFDIEVSGMPLLDEEGRVAEGLITLIDITDRKRAEEALRESEQRFRTMADGLPLLIWVHDTEGSQRFVNRTFNEFFGLSPEEMTPDKWASLMDPETATAYANEFLSCVREQRPFHGEVQVKRADGQWRWLESWGRPQYSASGEYSAFVGTSADITDRKKAEDALRESESFYRQTLESIPGMVFTTRPDGYCDYQSQQWVEYTGIPISEHLGNGWNNLLHPEDRSRVYAAWRDAVEERAPYDVEYRVRRRDGEYEWFKVVGRPIRDKEDRIVRWFGVALNIDLFKRTEEALRQSINEVKLREREARERGRILDAMMDYIPMGITIADAPDVTIRRVSRYGRELDRSVLRTTSRACQ